MSIVDYGTLKTAVEDMLGRSELNTYVPTWIQAAEARIYRECLVRQMETIDSQVTAISFPVPTDYIAVKECNVIDTNSTDRYMLERVSYAELLRQYPNRNSGLTPSGRPRIYARDNVQFEFGPVPDVGYTINLSYYARPPFMTADPDAPWPVTDAPDLILYGSLIQSAPFLRDDPRLAVWEILYQDARAGVLEEYATELSSGAHSMERNAIARRG